MYLFHTVTETTGWKKARKTIYKMQVLTVLVLTMATLLLLTTAVKSSPVLPVGDDELSLRDLRSLVADQDKEFKRICGMAWLACERNGVRKLFVFLIVIFLFFLIISWVVYAWTYILVWSFLLSIRNLYFRKMLYTFHRFDHSSGTKFCEKHVAKSSSLSHRSRSVYRTT